LLLGTLFERGEARDTSALYGTHLEVFVVDLIRLGLLGGLLFHGLGLLFRRSLLSGRFLVGGSLERLE